MAELSKTARASMKQGQVAKNDPFDTNEKKIHELMKQRDPKLGLVFVTRMDFVDALIEEYNILKDKLRMEVQTNNELANVKEPSPSEKLQSDLEPIGEAWVRGATEHGTISEGTV